MKVLCVDNSIRNYTPKEYESDLKLIEEGGEYEIESVPIGYLFIGIKCKNPNGYNQDRFIPVSDIDETEMERNYIKEKV